MMNMMLQQLAEELVKAREEVRLSPEQVAVKIKMDLKFLIKMENGDFSFLPDIYLKAFLKEYAKAVGLNEQSILQKYKHAKEGKAPTEKFEEKEIEKVPSPSPAAPILITDDHLQTTYSPEKKFSFTKNQLLAAGTAAVVVLAVLIYWFLIRQNADTIVTERPYEESVQENKERYEEDSTPADSSAVAAASDSLVLSVASKDSSWLRVNFDDGPVKEYFLYPKTSIEIKAASKFSMTVGNPGAVTFLLNNQPLQFIPLLKNRAIIEITAGGIKNIDPLQTQKQ